MYACMRVCVIAPPVLFCNFLELHLAPDTVAHNPTLKQVRMEKGTKPAQQPLRVPFRNFDGKVVRDAGVATKVTEV